MDEFNFIPPRSKTTYSCYFLEEDASTILILTMRWKCWYIFTCILVSVYQYYYHYSLSKSLLWTFIVHDAALCEESTVPFC